MTGTYDFRLVALSVVIAIFASFAALDLTGRITASRHKSRLFWLFGGASAMGLGIWSMHYIGMLAFRMPMKVLYDVPTVVLSLPITAHQGIAAKFLADGNGWGIMAYRGGGGGCHVVQSHGGRIKHARCAESALPADLRT